MSIIAESTHARKKESAQPILEAIASADKQRKLNSDPPVEKWRYSFCEPGMHNSSTGRK